MIRRLQNRVAESRRSLTLMSLYAIGAWLLMGVIDHQELLPCLGIFFVSTYLMVELNNRNSLLRTYSRMVSCSFIAFAMMLPSVYQSFEVPTLQLLFITVFTWLFTTYQRHDLPGRIYGGFLMLGLASLLWMPVVYLLPVYWVISGAFLLSLNFKNFLASLIAVLTPYWILLPISLYFERFEELIAHLEEVIPNDEIINIFYEPESLLEREWDIDAFPSYIPVVLLMIISLIGITHYLRNSFQDKIQTRMLYHTFVTFSIILDIAIIAVVFLPFQTAVHLPYLISMLAVSTAPLIGHFITFTNSRLTNSSFVIFFMLIIIVTIMQSPIIQELIEEYSIF